MTFLQQTYLLVSLHRRSCAIYNSPLEATETLAEGAHPEQPATAANPAEARERRRHGNDPREPERFCFLYRKFCKLLGPFLLFPARLSGHTCAIYFPAGGECDSSKGCTSRAARYGSRSCRGPGAEKTRDRSTSV